MKREKLPALGTSFVGREQELGDIVDLLRGADCRLLTLSGPGGSGKTRLALEAAGVLQPHFREGVAFVPLQGVSEPQFIAPAIAEAVRLRLHGPQDSETQLLEFLGDKELLLVIDNFEHLLDGAALLSSVLALAPGVRALVTSREVLNLKEEWVRPLAGLRFPTPDQAVTLEELTAYDAVRLFSERARQARHSFALEETEACVVQICRMVEGLPLALELAASWLRTLSCQEVAAEIERSLDFLETRMRNVPARHRSMRAVFQQSWQLLSEQEQDIFARLSVFRGGCTRAAAHAVAGASLAALQALVDKSLLVATPGGRYQIHELLRQFAGEKLAANATALAETQDRHMAYFADFLRENEPELKSEAQLDALQAIDGELDNIRVAWRRTVGQRAAAPIEAAMGSLLLYYQMRGRVREGLELFRAAAETFAEEGGLLGLKLQLFKTWFDAGVLSASDPSASFYREAFDKVQQLGEDESMAMPLALFAWTTGLLDEVTPLRRFYSSNYQYHRERGNTWGAAWAAYSLGTARTMMYGREPNAEELAEGLRYLEESLALFREFGNPWATTYALHAAAEVLMAQEEYERARELYHESLQICRHVGDPGGVAYALHGLGEIAGRLQEYEGSWRYLNDALQISYEHRSEMVMWHLFEMASAFAAAGHLARAVEIMSFLRNDTDHFREDATTGPLVCGCHPR